MSSALRRRTRRCVTISLTEADHAALVAHAAALPRDVWHRPTSPSEAARKLLLAGLAAAGKPASSSRGKPAIAAKRGRSAR